MVQIVVFDISQMKPADFETLYARASEERRQRADRYLRQEDRLRCIAADALLRYALQKELGLTEFTVLQEPLGKPRIQDAPEFHYNLSHSGNLAVIAWGDSEAGVDVEQIRMDEGKEKLARRFFTPEEQAFVFKTDEGIPERFYQIWTGKESYLKYLGTGLQKSLTSFDIFSTAPAIRSWIRDGYCISLCAEDMPVTFSHVTVEQLL